MPDDAIERSILRLLEGGLASRDELQGCSEDEMATIEKKFAVRLPATYRQFFAALGATSGHFLEGTDFHCSQVGSLREEAEELLRECGADWLLGATDFVFCAHQGYQFQFFDCSAGDDPPVRLFIEGDEGPREVYRHFTEWFDACVGDEIESDRGAHGT